MTKTKKKARIVLTGGHLSPLFATLDVLLGKVDILVIGRKHALEGDKVFSLEYKILTERKIPFKPIISGRWQRKWTRYTLPSLFKFPLGFFQSFFILRNFKPDVVVSFGGYISLPVVLGAFIHRIPVVLHEQTLEAGFSNKISSIFANKICISWESSIKFFPKQKIVLTGNPVRKFNSAEQNKNSNFKIDKEDGSLIYITGGSLGSHVINLLVEGRIEKLLEKFRVFHQTGDAWEYKDFERLQRLKSSLSKNLQERYFLTKFVDPSFVGRVIKQADLVVCRCGINTITELIFFSKPALLIPLPYSQDNEQIKNALFFEKIGLGKVVFQKNLTSQKLYEIIIPMMDNIKEYQKAREKAGILVKNDAAEEIAKVVLSATRK